MRIEISRSGGIAGMTRRWSLEVSPAEAEERWLPLVGEATGAAQRSVRTPEDQTQQPSPDQPRDRYVYTIVIGIERVIVPESRLDEPLRELIERARQQSQG